MKIIEVSEGAQPIGAPWEVQGIDSKLHRPCLETPVLEDVNGGYHPWLATSWKIDIAKNTITLYLRKGVKFHDGTDFNAKAAKWCLDNSIKARTAKGFLSVDVIDDYTVRINTEKYQNNYLNYLSGSGSAMVSPTYFEKNGAETARWRPVGTGPFKFVSFERGSKLTYTRWEGYWQKGKPYLDGVEYLFIRDPMTQQAAMQAKGAEKVHVLCVTSGEQAAMLKAQGFQVLTLPVGPVSLLPDSNNADSPLSKKKVREAISYAINREAIVKARGFGFFSPANQIPSPGQLGYVKNLSIGQYDRGKPGSFSLRQAIPVDSRSRSSSCQPSSTRMPWLPYSVSSGKWGYRLISSSPMEVDTRHTGGRTDGATLSLPSIPACSPPPT